MSELQIWNYEKSINKLQPLIREWKGLTLEIARELTIANSILSERPIYKLDKCLSNLEPVENLLISNNQTWEQYLRKIEMSRQMATYFIKRYDPEKNILLPSPIKINRINENINFPLGKYSVIYADPPWQYNNSGFEESAKSHYPTEETTKIINLEDISGKPVTELTTNDSVLFLWATNPFLMEGLEVVDSWGFKYKTNFAWIKNKGPSIGWFNKGRHELVLIGVEKDNRHPAEKYNSWFEAEVTTHSKKPELVYEMIERMYAGPYIELFARNTREGWDSWGNEVPKS